MTVDVQLITFDLGNVLVRVDHGRFCRRLAAAAGTSPEEVYRRVFQSSLEPGFDTGRLTPAEFYTTIMSAFNLNLEMAEFTAWWNDIFQPFPAMETLVAELAGRLPLFLLSNTNVLHFAYLRAHYPVLSHFDRLLLSFELGCRKPEPAIYQALIQAAGLPPAAILFIDDRRDFVAAAREQGLQAWQFQSPADLRQRLAALGLLPDQSPAR